MPPKKLQLNGKTGKHKVIQGLNKSVNIDAAGNEAAQDSVIDQFSIELCWCVQQLEESLSSGKLNPRQTQETEKIHKILVSNNQPVIKKRQVMRTTFGDYRSKMAQEAKKLNLMTKKMKFSEVAPNTKSHFIKKAAIYNLDSDFKFNFPVKEVENMSLEDGKENEINEPQSIPVSEVTKVNRFEPTNNEFRFNFIVEESK